MARYLTALKNGQSVAAKEFGETYQVFTLDMSSTGLSTATPGALTLTNFDVDVSGAELRVPQAAPASPVAGSLWEASGDLRYGATPSRTVMNLEGAQTVSGVKTFDTGTGTAPFAVAADNTLVVTNLNADKLDGQDGSYYTNIANLSIASQTTGDILYYNGGWTRLGVGTVGQLLQVSGGLPTWQTVTASVSLQQAYDAGNTIVTDASGNFAVSGTEGATFDMDKTSSFNVTGAGLTLSTTTSGTLALTSAATLDLDGAAVTLDASGASGVVINASAGPISIGSAANAQPINIGTGAAARKVTVGNATGVSEVEVNTGTAGFDVNALGPVEMDGTSVSIDGTLASNLTVTGGNLTLSTVSSGSLIATSATNVDINAATGVTIDGAAASNFTVTGAADLTLRSTLGSTILTSGESAADAVRLNATGVNGGVDIDALLGGVAIDTTAGISLDAAGASNFTVAGAQLQLSTTGSGELDFTAAGLIDINAGANLDIDVVGTTTLTSSVGTTIENTTSGNILIDNQVATGKIIAMLGTDTAATGLEIQNNSAAVLFSIVGTGQADFNFNLDANAGLDVSGGNLTLDSNDLIINSNKFTVDGATGDTLIAGNLTVTGTMFIADTQQVLIEDNNLYLNCTDVTPGAGTGGLTVNYNPTSTTDLVATGGFTVGVAGTSNPTVKTTGAATFSVGDFIQITGSNNAANKGLFEVLSHSANTLTIRGVGVTACQEDFTQNQFVTDPTDAGTITKVNVSVIRAGTDGNWEVAKGDNSPPPPGPPVGLVFVDLVTSASGLTLQAAYVGGNTITTSTGEGDLTFAGTEDLVVTLANIDLDPTGSMMLDLDSNKFFRVICGNTTVDETPSALMVQNSGGTQNFIAGHHLVEDTQEFIVSTTADSVYIAAAGGAFGGVNILTTAELGAPINILADGDLGLSGFDNTITAENEMLIQSGSNMTLSIPDNVNNVFQLMGASTQYITVDSTTDVEELRLGYASASNLEIYARSPIRFGNATRSTKGNLYQDNYGTHVMCYAPTGKSTTIAMGVAFLGSGPFEVSLADADQSTVAKMVRGVAQSSAAATEYAKVQISGIAEVEADTAESYDEGDLVKWNKTGKVTTAAKDLGSGYYEELAGVIVSMKNRAGADYHSVNQTRFQIMMMNPVIGTEIPA